MEDQLRFLRGALGLQKVFMEVGAERCALAHLVAGDVERVYAVCPRRGGEGRPPNLVPLVADWSAFPVPEGSVDVALSEGLLERLHPSHVPEHLRGVRRALRLGGRYFCITAARFGAKGLRALLAEVGFRKVRFYARIGGLYAQVPYWVARSLACLHVEAIK